LTAHRRWYHRIRASHSPSAGADPAFPRGSQTALPRHGGGGLGEVDGRIGPHRVPQSTMPLSRPAAGNTSRFWGAMSPCRSRGERSSGGREARRANHPESQVAESASRCPPSRRRASRAPGSSSHHPPVRRPVRRGRPVLPAAAWRVPGRPRGISGGLLIGDRKLLQVGAAGIG
jgi:hypothetical protein